MDNIPTKINILGRNFDIIKEKFAEHANMTVGATVMTVQRIWIDTDTHKQQQEETLIHEIIETIDTICELSLEHKNISILGALLYQVLSDNNLSFGDNKNE